MRVSLDSNYADLQRIYKVGLSPSSYQAAEPLLVIADLSRTAAMTYLGETERTYAQHASTAARQSTVGAAAAIVLLLCAFGLIYRRSGNFHRQVGLVLATTQKLALSDALTGLGNRRALVDDLHTALANATHHKPLLLGLFDLAGFKQYNDTFGHPAGDALLARLSERLRKRLMGLESAGVGVVWPLEAGTGATPARRAKAASERTRPGCDQATMSWAATIGPTPGLVQQLWCE